MKGKDTCSLRNRKKIGDVFYFKVVEGDSPATLDDLEVPSYCKVVDTNTGKAIVGFASFAVAEEIAKKYNLSIHSYTKPSQSG